ncbi:MAG: dynamin family protein [Tessaracoccus sp.]|uniref:dynamin family protein n=1 Tax=Tessaracoccus sp. TaxID=1971211 RepID=UPI001EC20FEF|nr:dynamin family protein [Tessaracoccus sp.]MBK7822283.1 dynamin family protein [Tessaracoccus sp.]
MTAPTRRAPYTSVIPPLDRTRIETIAKNLATVGESEAAATLRAGVLRGEGRPKVVVIGEVKRGKSTLVNALVGSVVSATGAALVTYCPVVLVPPDADRAAGEGNVVYAETGPGPTIPVAEVLARLARPEAGTPIGAEIAVERTLVTGIDLIDTPGVGGLVEAHAQVSLAALKGADALLFVTDGGQPLTAPELDFLRRASDAVEHVLFALTKVDLTTRWGEIEAEDRAKLRAHAPRFAEAPMFPVAAALAVDSWTAHPDDAEFLFDESGIAALAEGVRAAVGDADRVRAGNAVRAGLSGIERAAKAQETTRAALADPELLASLEADRARLTEFQARGKRATRFDVPGAINKLRRSLTDLIGTGCSDITHAFTTKLTAPRWTALPDAQFRAELQAELTALASRVTDELGSGLDTIAREAFKDLPEPVSTATVDLLAAHAIDVRLVDGAVVPNSDLLQYAALPGGMFMASRMAAWIAQSAGPYLGPLAPVATVVGWLMGAAPVAIQLTQRRKGSAQQQQIRDMQESISTLRSEATKAVESVLSDFHPALAIELEDKLTARIAELSTIIQTATAKGKLNEKNAQRVEQNLKVLATATRQLEEILEDLARGGGGSRVPPEDDSALPPEENG